MWLSWHISALLVTQRTYSGPDSSGLEGSPMHGVRQLHRIQDAGDNSEPVPHSGLLAWWQRRSWRMDLAVLARVRDGLKRLDEEAAAEESGAGGPVSDVPTNITLSERIADTGTGALSGDASAGATTTPGSDHPAEGGGGQGAGVLPDPAISSIRETFAIVAAAG